MHPNIRKAVLLLATTTLVTGGIASVRAANLAPVGGGVTRAGFDGEYFANPNFEGKPAFTRRDVRINFDWKEGVAGKGLPVGGATTPGMADFPLDEFSIRWTGAVVPRFSETYTLRVTGRDGLRVVFAGKVLVDSLKEGAVKEVATGLLKAGEKYDLVFEYVDRAGTGASEAKLEWSSPSTPWEVVDPLSYAQTCLHQASRVWNALEMANMVRMPCSFWKAFNKDATDKREGEELPPESLDENGWPKVAECALRLSHYGPLTYHGKYMIVFTGQANVTVEGGMPGCWNTAPDGSGEKFEGTLPKGKGYDPRSNTTRVWFDATASDHLALAFSEAERAPGQPGVADLQVYYPVANGSQEHHQPGEIYIREAREYFKNFTLLRQHIGTSCNPGWTWQDRTLPAYFRRDHQKKWGYCLEELIMAANDVGKDLHLCCGAGWDEDFMKKLAQLVRYGSDGVNPYDHYVENPKYPPLNPNLRIYLEHANELPWAVYPSFIWNDFQKKAEENHPDWKIVNYDGQCNGGRSDFTGMYRYHVLRMKQLSDAFRGVYSDVPGAIGERVRVLCMGQYAGTQLNTMMQFLDAYFNKADPKSTYVGEPHPPSYYIWGGGGAIYWGCANRFGFMETEPIVDNGFETPDIPAGKAEWRPERADGWTFAGQAGICDIKLPLQPAVISQKLPAEAAGAEGDGKQWAGFKFTVGDRDLHVYQLGRWIEATKGKKGARSSKGGFAPVLFDAGGKKIAETKGLAISDTADEGYAYGWLVVAASSGQKTLPATLEAGKTYYLVCEASGSAETGVTAAPGLKIDAAVRGASSNARTAPKWEETPGSRSYGPLNMLFTTEAIMAGSDLIGLAPDESSFEKIGYAATGKDFDFGRQCAFIKEKGSISREFTVEKAGGYWVNLNLCRDPLTGGQKNPASLHIKIDGIDLTPKGLPRGGYQFHPHVFHYHASHVAKLEAGKHTLSMEVDAPKTGTLFVDTIRLGSEEAFYGGPEAPNFPSSGRAIGQKEDLWGRTAQAECEMARNWGLVPMTYEGGWAVQADFDDYGMYAWDDLRYGTEATNHEYTKQALRNAFNRWCQKGGYIFAYFYSVSPSVGSTDAPLLRAIQECNDRLTVPPQTDNVIPGTLTFQQKHYQGVINSDWKTYLGGANGNKKEPIDATVPANGWKSWIVTSAETADYSISVEGSGGPAELAVDDRVLAKNETTGKLTAAVRLTAGVHSIKVKSGGLPVSVEKIAVTRR